jgi:hypothetical protein
VYAGYAAARTLVDQTPGQAIRNGWAVLIDGEDRRDPLRTGPGPSQWDSFIVTLGRNTQKIHAVALHLPAPCRQAQHHRR